MDRRISRDERSSPPGLGGMGGAQPLAATMAGAAILCVEVDPSRIRRRLETRYLDEAADSLDDALGRVRAAAREGRALSVGLLGNAADVFSELVRRGETFDLVTDQTAAHDPLTGYVPAEVPFEEAAALRAREPEQYLRLASESITAHVSAMLEFVRMGCYVFDYGNNLRGEAYRRGRNGCVLISGLRPGVYPTSLLSRRRAVPLGSVVGRSGRHRGDRSEARGAFPERRLATAMARACSGARRVSGTTCADLLAGVRRSRTSGTCDQRTRSLG